MSKSNTASPRALDPGSFLKEAIRAVPAVKYALGVGGVAAVVAIVAGFQIDLRVAVFGTVILFGLMFVLLVFARATTVAGRFLLGPILMGTWCFMLLLVATALFLMTSYFFQWPRSLEATIMAAEATVSGQRFTPGAVVHLSDIDDRNKAPLNRAAAAPDIVREVRRVPSLTLQGNQLDLTEARDGVLLVFSRLMLDAGSKILVGEHDVTIVVVELVASSGAIAAFLDQESGASGEDRTGAGQRGGDGHAGRSAGSVRLVVLGSVSGIIDVNLSGLAGGRGGSGGPGTRGADGAAGANAADHFFECAHGGGDGEPGHPGNPGAQGGNGGKGGNGGHLTVVAVGDAVAPPTAFNLKASAGIGGKGGDGGGGGPGGSGGPGGHGSTYCGGGHGGPNGPQGGQGPAGDKGQDGTAGEKTFTRVPLSDMPKLI